MQQMSVKNDGQLIFYNDEDDDDGDPTTNCIIGSTAGEAGKRNRLSPSGSVGREMMARLDNVAQSSGNGSDKANKTVAVADRDCNVYYNVQARQECGGCVRKDVVGIEGLLPGGSGELLKAILSDPVTGALMDDAVILPCGHSFGAGGIDEVKRMKACYTCSLPVSEESIKPNLSLRIVVQALLQEDDFRFIHSLKRRKGRSDLDKRMFSNSAVTDAPRSRGILFPFSVGDRIIIKGNKRTPPRFVGRRGVVTTQCLNGWYVIKTLDNAECVKLQHRSLAKISNDSYFKAIAS